MRLQQHVQHFPLLVVRMTDIPTDCPTNYNIISCHGDDHQTWHRTCVNEWEIKVEHIRRVEIDHVLI